MNFRVDAVIIGDSRSGHAILDKLAKGTPKIRVAFISKSFKSTTNIDYVHVKYIKNEVTYICYRHRLFYCYLANGDIIFSTHVVVATGVDYEPFIINNVQIPCVFHSAYDVSTTAKDEPALVICNNNADAKLALDISKKYKQVYLCTNALDIAKCVSAATAKKLAKTENIAVVPNTSIRSITNSAGTIKKVELDNYAEISCSAIYVKTAAKPVTEFIPANILSTENGYPVVTETCESTLVPKFFAAGNCLKKYTLAMEQTIVDTILKDF